MTAVDALSRLFRGIVVALFAVSALNDLAVSTLKQASTPAAAASPVKHAILQSQRLSMAMRLTSHGMRPAAIGFGHAKKRLC